MKDSLVNKFLKKIENNKFYAHKAFEGAFYLPKIDKPKYVPLRNTSFYSMPTHTVQRASILLNETLEDINNDAIIANVQEIIRSKGSVVAGR
jgi:hypothetical protein